ncbi:hypothetical protein F7732_05480 [Bacillus mesophilum]|uniref:Uncharacterized protein n=1 Tax=Bacillus mesophilum TaxID=1071718 RepID=A0A7V7UVN4_9BACI|nr:hypothetical protein F7732_05480 [Bacillus mesophilum]
MDKLLLASQVFSEKCTANSYSAVSFKKGRGTNMGKKHRNRINSPKKNNHIPEEAIIAEQEAHGKEYSASGGRKNGPGSHK